MTSNLAIATEIPTPPAPILHLAGVEPAGLGGPVGDTEAGRREAAWFQASLSTTEAAALESAFEGVTVTREAVCVRCQRTWGPAGLAKKNQDGEWRVGRDADPHFRAMPRGAEVACDMRDLTDKQRTNLLFKKAAIQFYKETMAKGRAKGRWITAQAVEEITARWCKEHGDPKDVKTIRGWVKKAGSSKGDDGLVDQRARRSGCRKDRQDDPFLNFVADLWLNVNQPKLTACLRTAEGRAREMGWQVWGEGVARRFIAEIPKTTVILRRHGAKAFEDQVSPFIERDYSPLASNEIWVADNHTFDVMVRVGTRLDKTTGEEVPVYGRPYLTAWQDMRSRMFVGWVIGAEYPCTETIIEALARGCRTYGVPLGAYCDNGRDFSAQVLTGETKKAKRERIRLKIDGGKLLGIFAQLGMRFMQAWNRHPQSKGIERAFGTVCDQFSRTFKTYCGKDTVSKPEGLEDRLHLAPTLEEFTARFSDWLEHVHHQTIHQGDAMGVTPLEAFQANLKEKRVAREDVLELLLWPRYGPYKVGQNGINHKGLHYGAAETAGLFGQTVYIRVNPEDISTVRVYDAQDRIVCMARANRRLPANAGAAELRDAIAEKKRITKAIKAGAQARLRMHHDATDLMIEAAISRNEAAGRKRVAEAAPAVLKPVGMGVEQELKIVPLKPEPLPPRPKMPSIEDLLAAFPDEDEHEARRPKPISILDLCPQDDDDAPKRFVYYPDPDAPSQCGNRGAA